MSLGPVCTALAPENPGARAVGTLKVFGLAIYYYLDQTHIFK
jgi:hypothetical protein